MNRFFTAEVAENAEKNNKILESELFVIGIFLGEYNFSENAEEKASHKVTKAPNIKRHCDSYIHTLRIRS
jgi:hypothetical protein